MAETTLIQGRYQLLDLIGRGGMGEVWRARDESLGRRVAVKCLKPLGPQTDRSLTRITRERFRREARVAAALQHRGVTVVHDFGDHEGVLYLVMELLEGRNLSQLLEHNQRRPLPVAEVVDIAEQVSDALAYTHEQGIVHRDLKPANIMRLTDGTVKICDFGIARLGRDPTVTSQLTGTGIAMGTPHYMSPEQIGSGQVDHRSDLYSLGCVLYEIATGAPPFDLEDAWSVLVGHRDAIPEPPRAHRPELPAYFDRLVLDLLAKTPEERPADAGVLRRRFSAARSAAARRSGVVFPGDDAVPASSPDSFTRPAPGDPGPPAWTRSITLGHRAAGPSRRSRAVPPDPSAELSGIWTGLVAPEGATKGPGPAGELGAPRRIAELAARHRAGVGLGHAGHWDEARDALHAVAVERAYVLGPLHPSTLSSRYEVGVSLSRTGRPHAALREFAQVAEGREGVLGADHPETLEARRQVARVLGGLGRHFEANQVHTALLAARERTTGPEHPDTLRCRHELALNLGGLGRHEDARRLAAEVAEARSRILGPGHPDTLVSQYEVACALSRLGRWQQAWSGWAEVAAARARALGPDHPDTLAVRYDAAGALGRLGRAAEALDALRALVHDRTRVDGPDHPETLRARYGLTVALGRLDCWEETLTESRAVTGIRERVLGPDHPDTLTVRRESGVALGRLGRWDEALLVYRQVADARERTLGAAHRDTLSSRNDEAHCLERLGRSAEALRTYRRVASVRGPGETEML